MTVSAWRTAFPSQWETRRLKYLAPVSNERVGVVEENDFYLGLEGIQAGTGKLVVKSSEEDDASTNSDEGEAFGTANIFHAGDVLFGKLRPYLAKLFLADRSGHCSTEILVLKPSADVLGNFLKYALLSPDFIQSVDSSTFGARMPRASWDFIGNINVPVPPLSTQRRIADFLDRETAQIDALIEAKEQMLALLQEKRAAQISHMVTKGLDPNVEMKDSGLEWLGEIPAHWEVKKIKHVADVRGGITLGKDYGNRAVEEYSYLRVANVQDGNLNLESVYKLRVPPEEAQSYMLRAGDVLMNEGGDADKLGRGAVWHGEIEPCLHQNHVFAVRPFAVDSDWLNAWTTTHQAKSYFENRAKRSTNLASISNTNVREMPFVCPPKAEQMEILSAVAAFQRYSERVTLEIELSLTLLRERRSALITAAVTGQLPEVLE